MDAIQKRIRTLNETVEKLDQVDVIALLDIGGHVIIDLFGSEATAAKTFILNKCEEEIESLRKVQKWAVLTSQAPKEGIVQ